MSDKKNRTKSRRSKWKFVKTRQMILAGRGKERKTERKKSIEQRRREKQK